MDKKNIEEKLTPAARDALDELITNYRDQILFNAMDSATELPGELEEISVRDIISGIEKTKSKVIDRKWDLRTRMLRTLMLVGIIYAFIGIGYYIYTNLEVNFAQQVGLIAAFAGLSISLVSYFLLNIYKEKYRFSVSASEYSKIEPFKANLEQELVRKWGDIELSSRDLIASIFGESKANLSLTSILEFLLKKEILNENDYIISKRLLEMRNKILHEGKEFNKVEIENSIKMASKILDKIRARLM